MDCRSGTRHSPGVRKEVKLIKYWYYGTLFLIFDFSFRIALYLSDNWGACQRLYSTGEYYLAKAKANRP